METSEQIVAYMDIRPHELGLPPLDDMLDNRDVSVMRSWDPLERVFDADMQRQSFAEEVCSFVANFLMSRRDVSSTTASANCFVVTARWSRAAFS